MSRSRPSKTVVRIGILAIILVLGGATFSVFNAGSKPFRTTPELDPALYASSAESQRGNTYKLEAVVVNVLDWSPSEGRIISVETVRDGRLLPLLVTADFSSTNIQKGQRFLFLVEVGSNGILFTKEIRK